MHDVAVALDRHEVDDLDRARPADPAQVVAAQVDQHQVLGPLLGVGEQLGGQRASSSGSRPPAGAGDRVQHRPAVRSTLTSASGLDPTTSNPSKRSRYMYGLGLVARSTR